MYNIINNPFSSHTCTSLWTSAIYTFFLWAFLFSNSFVNNKNNKVIPIYFFPENQGFLLVILSFKKCLLLCNPLTKNMHFFTLISVRIHSHWQLPHKAISSGKIMPVWNYRCVQLAVCDCLHS